VPFTYSKQNENLLREEKLPYQTDVPFVITIAPSDIVHRDLPNGQVPKLLQRVFCGRGPCISPDLLQIAIRYDAEHLIEEPHRLVRRQFSLEVREIDLIRPKPSTNSRSMRWLVRPHFSTRDEV
jgi:hypothetical protein